jgi:hypothetical protein
LTLGRGRKFQWQAFWLLVPCESTILLPKVACTTAADQEHSASTATIVRIFYVWQLTHDNDILYDFTDLAVWSTVENGLGLTASSIATLRPLFKSFLGVATQHRLSSPWSAIRRASKNIKSHSRGLSFESGDPYYRMGPYPPSRAASAKSSRRSDAGSSETVASPKKYNWQTFDAYESHRDVIAGYYHPVSPRVVRARWYSDGTRYYRLGGHSREHQQSRNHGRGPGYGHGPSNGPRAQGRQSV